MRTKAFSFSVLLFLSSLLLGQDIKYLGIENGMSNNYVVSITQDHKGFLWFATESGLNKFDGNKFKVYNKNTQQSISGNELNKVYADKFDNLLWIATQRQGLDAFCLETEQFKHYKHQASDSSIVTNDITDISNASDGNLWIATYHRGVDYLDKSTENFVHYNSTNRPGWVSDNVWAVREHNGYLFIGHVSAGLSLYSLKEQKIIHHYLHKPSDPKSLPGNEVRAICIDKSGNVWLGTNNGLALFDMEKRSFTVFRNNPLESRSLISNTIYCIEQLDDDKLWIGTENGGVSILDIRRSMFLLPQHVYFENIPYRSDNSGLTNQTIRSIFQDSFGNIWLGTYGGGVNFISAKKPLFNTWSYLPKDNQGNELTNKIVWGICADSKDRLWIGTDGGGLHLFSKGKRVRIFTKEAGDIGDNAILSATSDSEGNLWFGTFSKGVFRYDTKRKEFTSLKLSIVPKAVRCFYEDKGCMWIGTDSGLFYYDPHTGRSTLYTAQNFSLPENLVRSINKDKNGNLWLGFFGQGLCVFDSRLQLLSNYTIDKGFPSNTVNHIFKDSRGCMWIATGEGLVLFESVDTFEFRTYKENDGLIDSHIRAIAEDGNQNIWFSSNGGISRYILATNRFYNYNHFDGLPLGNFMSGSVTQSRDGSIYFGSQNGVCYFNPLAVPVKIKSPPAAITEFKVYQGKIGAANTEINIPVAPTIALDYRENTFNVSFGTFDYALEHLMEYAYMFQGLENIWYSTQNERSVTFRNIPPGTYQLLIKSRVKNQDWEEPVARLKITIRPPLWLTWWAKFCYALIVLSGLIFIIRFYKQKLDLENTLTLEKSKYRQEKNLHDERLRFFTNITHELRTPLTLILGPLEDLNKDNSLPEKQAAKVSVIYKSATRLLKLINQLLEFRKTETQNKQLCVQKGNPLNLLQEIAGKYKELNKNERISFQLTVETKIPDIYFDPEALSSIVENLLSNAFKYTDGGSITLFVRTVDKDGQTYVEIEVKDTGRGIPEEAISKIFDRYYQVRQEFQSSGSGIGLALVRNLVQLHEGNISVRSKAGEGSSFKVTFPVENSYPEARHTDDGALAESGHAESITEGNLGSAREDEAKRVILAIEDNEEIRNYIASSLNNDYKVYTADNGTSGLKEARQRMPDIIISDIMMPEMDGFQLLKALKTDVRTSHIPIILLTAKDTIQDKTEAYELGAESYITKPFSAHLLKIRIQNLLEARRKLSELIRNNTANKNAIAIESLSRIDNEFIDKVTSVIEENLESDKIDVACIAEKMFMSHSTLYRKIKALTNMSVNEFIRKVRIRNAEQLLLTRKYTVSEIAYLVGINSMNYFRQCFKDEFGLTPSEYLKQLTGEHDKE